MATSEEAVRAQDIAGRLAHGGLKEVQESIDEVFAEVTLPQADRVSDWGVVLDTVGQVRDTLEVFRPEVFDIPLGDLVAATGTREYREAGGVALGWYARWRLRRQGRGLLRPSARLPTCMPRCSTPSASARPGSRWPAPAGRRDPGRPRPGARAYDTLADELTWLGERLAPTAAGGDLLSAELPGLQARMAELAARPSASRSSRGFSGRLTPSGPRAWGRSSTTSPAGDRPRRRQSELEFVWWTSLAEHLTVADAAYGAHDGDHLRRIAREYIDADHAHLAGTAQRVKAAAGRRLREVLADHPEQESLVRAEAGKSRRHRPLRDLLPRAGETLTAIKPAGR